MEGELLKWTNYWNGENKDENIMQMQVMND